MVWLVIVACSWDLAVDVGVLILVKIDICQYSDTVKRQTDPDVLLLQAAADPTRLAILRQLSDSSEVCACDFTACCDVSQPTVSHHLKVLREAGVVVSERRGSWIFYRLAPDVAQRLDSIARGLLPGGLIPVGELTRGRAAGTSRPAPA
jgi:ArsR family transcriptional regulator, arsenate/arsenite/antimonite-responsive transcriptional repressor